MPHLQIGEPRVPVDIPPVLASAGADRRLGGPYAAASALARVLVPRAPLPVVAAHDIELRAIAPDLAVPVLRTTLSESLSRDERILVPAPQRTLRIANGFAEFVRDAITEPCTFFVTSYAEADPADREVIDVLVRRVPRLTVVTCDAPGTGGRAEFWAGLWEDGDAARHREAVEWCQERGCHEAAVELGRRALFDEEVAEPDTDDWWAIVHATAIGLGSLKREEEAAELLAYARARTTDPLRQSTIAYTDAMLLTRHHDPGRRDLEAALGLVNIGIALCGLLPDRENRAVKLGFDLNGKALIQARRGLPGEALALVEEAIELADRDLPEGAQPVHRMVLRANRAQLLAARGRHAAALADLDAAIGADPGYPDYYIDRGNLLVRLGREEDALADYETAMRVGPPFPEAYYNRAEVRFTRGDHEGALADLDYALELDPGFVDALVNRAGLLAARGEYGRARADAEAGLAADPGNPYLLCALGQVESDDGDVARAWAAFEEALRREPSLAAAWAGRGMLAYELGKIEEAIADLDRAVGLSEEPGLLFNRAMALRAAGREREAVADLTRALELDPDDLDIRLALTG
ncbi:tetratricopeptide repeat protein [Actinocorallia populi]|uniref:tetratricopeptide repeat protein n=1 Tax=Actinocorallia populi TaxID=2079200 RepID=UPI000D0966B1|nr:tetratricopeptide repeat protein [Actinocorallia populi]